MSVTCLPPQPGKNVSFLKSALKSQITWQNSEGNQTSEGKIVSLWTLTYQTLLTISTKPSSQVPGPMRTLAGLSYWMRGVAMSAFHDFSGTFSCWSAVLNRGKDTLLPILWYWRIRTLYLVPPEGVECLPPQGPLQPPMASFPLTTASSTVSVPQCDQGLLSIISASVPQPGWVAGDSFWYKYIWWLNIILFICADVCIYIKMKLKYL